MNDDVPAASTMVQLPRRFSGVGTYTVADGTVHLCIQTPELLSSDGCSLKIKNGTQASATYTPTVTPVTPSSNTS